MKEGAKCEEMNWFVLLWIVFKIIRDSEDKQIKKCIFHRNEQILANSVDIDIISPMFISSKPS